MGATDAERSMRKFAAHIEAALHGNGSVETIVTSEDARDLRAVLKVLALQRLAIEEHKKREIQRYCPRCA